MDRGPWYYRIKSVSKQLGMSVDLGSTLAFIKHLKAGELSLYLCSPRTSLNFYPVMEEVRMELGQLELEPRIALYSRGSTNTVHGFHNLYHKQLQAKRLNLTQDENFMNLCA